MSDLSPLSNRPFWGQALQTITTTGVDVARGLVLLFGIAPRPLYGAFFCQEFARAGKSFVLRQCSLFISKPVSSSDPAGSLHVALQELSRLAAAPTLRHAPSLPGHTFDSFERDGTLGAIRDDDQREPAFGADQVPRHNLVSVGPRTRTMMQSCASQRSSEAADPFFIRHESQGRLGIPPLEPLSASRHQWRTGPNCWVSFSDLHSYAGRRTTPSGTTPFPTRRTGRS